MNLLFLSPHFPPNFFHFAVRLKQAGVNVLGLAETPYDHLRPELREALGDYYQVQSMENYDEVYRAVGLLLHRHGRIDRVESHNETWLILESQLREDFHIPGVKLSEVEKIKKKSKMKAVFQNCGVRVARGELYVDFPAAKRFADMVGYPVFAKPNIGVGAACTYKINNLQDLESFVATKPPDEYIIEEFIDGNLATFDGMTDQNGNIVYFTSHYCDVGVFEIVTYNEDLAYYSLRNIPKDLETEGLKSIKAFGVKEKFFHLEFLRQKKDGTLVAMEINMRPPGGFTTDMMNFADDIDVYQEWTNIVTKNTFEPHIERKYHCAHVARKWGKEYQHSHDEIIEKYGAHIAMNTEVSQIFSAVMGNYVYLVRSTDLKHLKEIIGFIHQKA